MELVTLEFLQCRVRGWDKLLEQHLETCTKNGSYILKTSQNNLISFCGQSITELVVRKIKGDQYFSVLEYEDSDCSNQEQLSLGINNCKNNNKTIHTHCRSHRLNLVIGASYNIQCVRNIFDQIK